MNFCLWLLSGQKKDLFLQPFNHVIHALYFLIFRCQGEVLIHLFLLLISWMASENLSCNYWIFWDYKHIWECHGNTRGWCACKTWVEYSCSCICQRWKEQSCPMTFTLTFVVSYEVLRLSTFFVGFC